MGKTKQFTYAHLDVEFYADFAKWMVRLLVFKSKIIISFAEQQEPETKLPSTVRVELVPADNQTWAHVQGLAQNPRVHILAPLQYRLTNLLRYLQKRWLPRHEKYVSFLWVANLQIFLNKGNRK